MSTPFERAGPNGGAPVRQIAASCSSKVVQRAMAGKHLEMLDAPHSTAPTSEGVALRFPPPRTGSAGNETALAECASKKPWNPIFAADRAATTIKTSLHEACEHQKGPSAPVPCVKVLPEGWNGRRHKSQPMWSATRAHSICCLEKK